MAGAGLGFVDMDPIEKVRPMAIKEGTLNASGLKIAILSARFNQFVTERLTEGAIEAFRRHGGNPEDLDVIRVPGAFEMPLTAKKLAAGGGYDALVAVAAVIRGDTSHSEYVSGWATTGLAQVAQESGIPLGFGVLTTETVEQAIDRAGAKSGNKGAEAMITAIEMANLLKELD